MGKRILKIIAVLLLLSAAFYAAYETLKVRDIVVRGIDDLDADDIIALSGIEYGQSVFLVDKQAAINGISEKPFVKPVMIEIEYPDKVVITLEERKRAAYIEKDGALLVIDNEGWLLEVLPSVQDTAYPFVYGVATDAVQVGQRIGTSDVFKLDVLSRVLQATAQGGLMPAGIDVSLAADIVLTMRDGMKIELGDDTQLEEKMMLIQAMIDKGYSGGTLGVASLKNPYYRPAGGDADDQDNDDNDDNDTAPSSE